jgi:hypothetical protein
VPGLLDPDLDVVAFDLYAVETDFTVGLQSIESSVGIRLCAVSFRAAES